MKAVIVGSGGHARSVIAAIRSLDSFDLSAMTDPRPDARGTTIDGVQVVGTDDELARLYAAGVRCAVIGVGGAGSNAARTEIYGRLKGLGFDLPPIVHAAATLAPDTPIGEGSVVLAGAVVGPGVEIGANVIVNTGAIVEHGCRIGSHAHIASGAVLGGDVEIGAGAHIGLGATVIQGIRIGHEALVGAGAAVVSEVAGGVTVVGVPAAPFTHRP